MDHSEGSSVMPVPPVVHARGSHHDLGQQIGEAMRSQVRHGIENVRSYFDSHAASLHLSWSQAILQAMQYMHHTLGTYPQYIDEIMGIAEGANVSYADLVVVNTFECLVFDALHLEKCTSIAASRQATYSGGVLVGHNEDWLTMDEPDIYILDCHPINEPAFLAISYGGLLPNIGFNAAGIAQSCNSVNPVDVKYGIPRIIVSRAILATSTLQEAIRLSHVPMRAAGYNHLLAHQDGRIYNVEVSATRFEVIRGSNNKLVHTNHYLTPRMQEIEKEREQLIRSNKRFSRALSLLEETELHTPDSFFAILSDHENYPDSICNHAMHHPLAPDPMKTIFSVVMDLSALKMFVKWGNPCSSQVISLSLNS